MQHLDIRYNFASSNPNLDNLSQVGDTSKLDYEAGQEAGQDDNKEKPPQKQPQKQPEQQQQAADDDTAEDGPEGAGVNENMEDKYEDSHFAPPTAPEQVSHSLAGMRFHYSCPHSSAGCMPQA